MRSSLFLGTFLYGCFSIAFASYDRHMISIQEMRSGSYESQGYLTRNHECYEKFEIDKEKWTVRTRPVHNPLTGQHCVFADDPNRRTFYKCTYDECFSSKNAGVKLFFIDANTILRSEHRVANYFSFFRTTAERVPTVFSSPRNSYSVDVTVPKERKDDYAFIEGLKEKTILEIQGPLRKRVEKEAIDTCEKYHPVESCVITESSLLQVQTRNVTYAHSSGVSKIEIFIRWMAIVKL